MRVRAGWMIVALLACAPGEREQRGAGERPGATASAPPAPAAPSVVCGDGVKGCPCDEEGAEVLCEDAYSEVGDQVVCGKGLARCEAGRWGECMINGSVRVGVKRAAAWVAVGLGGPTSCASSCDPLCTTFPDDPSGVADPSQGTTEGNGGLTLPGNDGGGLIEAPCTGGTSGSCAHSLCEVGDPLSAGCDATQPGEPSCAAAICDVVPSCCTTAWDTDCTTVLESICGVSCFATGAGECVSCYDDDFDHDGDGYSSADGDCMDCDELVNPGAYDFPGDGRDDDCSGVADDEPADCDTGLPMTSGVGMQHAAAIDLCRQTSDDAQGSARSWGVVEATLSEVDGGTSLHSRGHQIATSFGSQNVPQRGKSMVVYSSGAARTPGQAGYVNPSGQFGSYDARTQANYPPGFPKNAGGCPGSSGKAYDSVSLQMRVRVPTNAKSFSYSFAFFSSEYPEWLCTAYNDHFVALLTGSSATPVNPPSNSNNISFDANGDPVSVNNAFFSEPACATCTSPVLDGTGFDGWCWSQACGGATGWLQTSAPVVGGETIDIRFAVWDQGDHVWDSTVLIDNWRWSGETSPIVTGVVPPAPPPITYEPGVFERTYDASDLCPKDMSIQWGHWSWQSSTPDDSAIAFSVQTADTLAGLDGAPREALSFTDPPGPSALVGERAVAASGPPNTESGAVVVDEALRKTGGSRHSPYLRIRSDLLPSSDQLSAPTLLAWNLEVSCVTNL